MKSEKKETVRLPELDIVKTVAIFLMVMTHVGEILFSYEWEDKAFCPASGVWQILDSWATILAPAIFMFSMGASINFSRRSEPGQWIARGLKLILTWFLLKASYCLVAIRHICAEDLTPVQYLVRTVFYSDILCFAGLFFVILGLLRKCRVPKVAIALLALGLFAAGQFIALEPPTVFLQAVTGLFVATPVTAFPLFNWMILPLLGLAWGWLLCRSENRDRFFLLSLCASLPVLMGIGVWYWRSVVRTGLVPRLNVLTAYVVTPGILVSSFAVFLFLCTIFHFLVRSLGNYSLLTRACSFVAIRLTVIYCIQWVVIPCIDTQLPMWSAGTVVSPFVILGCSAAIYAVCVVLSIPIRRLMK